MRIPFILAVVLALTAAADEKPILVFNRPPECRVKPEDPDWCEPLQTAAAHPAMQRRLAPFAFKTKFVEGERGSLEIQDPSGRTAMRWSGILLDWLMLADVLTVAEIATPRLLESHRATLANEPDIAEREWALAILALGDKDRGRALLESMRASASRENRELAAVWLERLSVLEPKGKAREDVLERLARTGATPRVRVEALVALGDLRMRDTRYDEAMGAYDRAVAIAPARSTSLQNALIARQTAIASWQPVIGLGAPGAVVAGRKTLQPRITRKDVARVEFKVDGKLVATARRKPFGAAVPFARVPARQVLEVIAKNRAGNVVSRSSLVVNERSEAFEVDIVEPREQYLAGPVDVAVEARVPRGRSATEVLVEWNGARVARFTRPPYRTKVDIPANETGVLRAVLRLDDGSETEDVLFANAKTMMMESEAHLVEVPAYFEGATPAASQVTVREGGRRRAVEQVISPANAPLLIALLFDSSSSMNEHMLDLEEAAVRFVEEHLTPRDRTLVMAFSSTPRVILRASNDRELVKRSILSLRPRGGTALHDAIIAALLQLHSSGSRRALVVFSDGYDVSSVFSSEHVTEVARRTGVPIYVLAFIPSPEGKKYPLLVEQIAFHRRALMALSERTGGKAFEMRSLQNVGALWNEIGADLERQSLVIYRTDTAGAEWRTLDVTVRGGAKVRAPAGVYVTADDAR